MGNTFHIQIFFYSLHTFVMYGLSIYEIKKFQFMDTDSVSGFLA